MSIREGDKKNFETLQEVFRNGDQCIIECQTLDGKYVAVICAATKQEDGSVVFQPFARMFEGNPYEEVLCPTDMEVEDGIEEQEETKA